MTHWETIKDAYGEFWLFDFAPTRYCWMCGAEFKARMKKEKKPDRYGITWYTWEGKFCDRVCHLAWRRSEAEYRRFRFL